MTDILVVFKKNFESVHDKSLETVKNTLKELETTQNTYRIAQHSANVMEKAMSKLTTKVESNSLKQKELSVLLEKSQNEKIDLQKKLDMAYKRQAKILADMEKATDKAKQGDKKDILIATIKTERDLTKAKMEEVSKEFQKLIF